MGESAGRISEPELLNVLSAECLERAVHVSFRFVSFSFFFLCDLYVEGYAMGCNR